MLIQPYLVFVYSIYIENSKQNLGAWCSAEKKKFSIYFLLLQKTGQTFYWANGHAWIKYVHMYECTMYMHAKHLLWNVEWIVTCNEEKLYKKRTFCKHK